MTDGPAQPDTNDRRRRGHDLLAALRRLVVLVVLTSAGTAVLSLVAGLLLDSSPRRSLTLGFYIVGCFFMVAGFFIGNRGPARVKSEGAGSTMIPFPLFGSRQLRWATGDEQHETINNSAVFIALGFIVVLIGILLDTQHKLF